MSRVNRWQLPEGVAELLPSDARRLETLRRQVLDLFTSWGYEQVIPPLVEFTDSLLIGTADDLERLTVTMTDQLTGRQMGLRADMTPQIARIDAHSYCQPGPSRFSYVGTVVHARPRSLLANRTPTQAGVELYGVADLKGDVEIISLLLETLQSSGVAQTHLDLGHAAILRALTREADFTPEQELDFLELLQGKAKAELQAWIARCGAGVQLRAWLAALPDLAGGTEVLAEAREVFKGAPAAVIDAIDELESVAAVLGSRYPGARLYFDLGEVRGYHYHSGVVFAGYVPGFGEAVANGGRYDNVGEVFGRGRPATGFSVDLAVLMRLSLHEEGLPSGIWVKDDGSAELWAEVQRLRAGGEQVIFSFADEQPRGCDRQLLNSGKGFELRALS